MLSINEAQKDIQRLMDTVSLYRYRKPLFQRLGRALVNDAKMNFVREHEPDGTPWEPLKIREGRILSDTGRLKNSLSYATGDDEVQYGTNVFYAATHQFGAVIKPVRKKALKFPGKGGKDVFAKQVTIPARPFLGIEDKQIQIIQREMDKWVRDVATRGSRNV